MPNTLHILSLSRRAGLEIMFLNYLKHMKQEKPEYIKDQYVLGFEVSSYFREELVKLGINLFIINNNNNRSINNIKYMMDIIDKRNIKIVYGQNFIGNLFGAVAKTLNKDIKLINHEHGTAWSVSGIKSYLTKFSIQKSDLIICNSNAASILLRKRFRAPENKIKVIMNGVPSKKKKKYEKNKYQLLFVGRLNKIKSPHTLLEMMSYLLSYNNNFQLDILGDGPEYYNLLKSIEEQSLEKYIKLHGSVENVEKFMETASWLLVPSIREPLGNVIIEAAFNGVPAIGTRVDGIPEVIEEYKTGYLVEPKKRLYSKVPVKFVVDRKTGKLNKPLSPSGEDLANKIIDTLKNKVDYEQMGEEAYKRVNKLFNINRYFNELDKTINNLYSYQKTSKD